MAKALKTAALVVGAVALVATGVGAAIGAAAAASTIVAAGVSVATVATVASVAAGVLSLAAGLTAKKPSAADATGSQTSFSADPDAGIPAALGRTGTAGNIVARFGFDTKDAGDNDRQSFVSVLSLGPVAEVEEVLGVDRTPVAFNAAGQALGQFSGFMWRKVQTGLLAGAALTFGTGAGSPPGWTEQHRLSGKAATTWTLRFDTKSKLYQNGVPAPMNVVRGRLVYDPRKDSTYPGGSGPHRMADPADRAAYDAAFATWEWSENPYLHALAFVHGYWQRDMANPASDWQRVMGMGAPAAGIDLAAFVEGANIADANGWMVGGVIFSGDDKWASLKKILQAGMGEPLALGAKISCLVNAPRVSLATIGIDDVVGDASVGATQPRRDRINTITPRFRLEENDWQLLPGSPITVAEHVVTDRGKRSKTQDYPLIQSAAQVGTAVRYDIENAREFGPIVLPCKLVWMGYKPGDCVSVDLPELGLVGQPILLLNRELDPSAGIVTLTARSETATKHAYALGQTATPPPTPGVTGAPIAPVPADGAWLITGTSIEANGVTMPALVVTGAVEAGTAQSVTFEYRPFVNGQPADAGWIAAGTENPDVTRKVVTGVASATAYEVAVRYTARNVVSDRRIVGPTLTASYSGIKGDRGESAPLVMVQWSVDGLTGWHINYADGDIYQRQSNDNGQTFGPAVRVVGESASSGLDGVSPSIVFIRSAITPTRPSRDTGNPPTGWSDKPPTGSDFLWQSVSKFRSGTQLEDWSDPARITGPAGIDGASAFTLVARGGAMVASNSVVKRNDWPDQWDSDAYSTAGYRGGAAATFRLSPDQNAMAGLNTDPLTDGSFASLDHAWWGASDGNARIYENGVAASNPGNPDQPDVFVYGFGANGDFQVVYDNKMARYLYNGVVYREVALAPDKLFYFDSSIRTPNGKITAIAFTAAGAAGENGKDAPLVRTQWSIDGSTNWHDSYFGADIYYRQSNDGGITYGPAIRGVGEAGTVGTDGLSPSSIFIRSAVVPATPATSTGNPPPGWSDGPPAGSDFLWLSTAKFRNAAQVTAWSPPQRISGDPGAAGADAITIGSSKVLFGVPTTAAGVPKPGYTGDGGTISVFKGGVAITPDSYALAGAVNMASLALNGATYSFAGITADTGYFFIQAVVAGRTYQARIDVQKVKDGSAALGVSSQYNTNAASYSAETSVAFIDSVIPAGATVSVAGSAGYAIEQASSTAGNRSFVGRISLYVQNITDGGPLMLVDRRDGSTATWSSRGGSEPDVQSNPGIASGAGTFTGAGAPKTFRLSVAVQQSGGTGGQAVSLSGSLNMGVSG